MPGRYHLLSVLSIFATWLVVGLATPLTRNWNRTTVKHSWNAVPEFWESLGHPPADTTIDLYLELKPQHEDALTDALREVSDPRHAKYVPPPPIRARMNPFVPLSRCRYGAHLSMEQVTDLVAPHPDTLNLVNSWLEDHGVPPSSVSMTLGGNWLIVAAVPVPQANVILGASYQLYQHVEMNDTVLRTVSYSLPEALHGHIQTVAPTTYFGSLRTQWKTSRIRPSGVAAARAKAGPEELVTVPPSRKTPVTPSYLRLLYHTLGYVPAAVGQNAIGTAGYRMEYPSPQDLSAFMKEYRTDGEDATFTVVPINGGVYDPNNPGIEASLNLQFAEAITYPTRNIYYSTGGQLNTATDPYLHWLAYLLKQKSIPQTISTTYGGPEYSAPQGYAVGLCHLFAQLGLRGVSVIFSSGDWGVGRGNCVRFLPEFPASCTCGVLYSLSESGTQTWIQVTHNTTTLS